MIKEALIFVGGLVTGAVAIVVMKEENKRWDIPFINSGCVLTESPIKPEETEKV